MRLTRFARRAIPAMLMGAISLSVGGCIDEITIIGDGDRFECSATLRPIGGGPADVEIVTTETVDFNDRDYTHSSDCPSDQAVYSVSTAHADWTKFLAQRVSELRESEDSQSIFSLVESEWCIQVADPVDPGSLCQAVPEQDFICNEPNFVDFEALPFCAAPPEDGYLQATCDNDDCVTNDAGEILLDFGELDLGNSAAITVLLANRAPGSSEDSDTLLTNVYIRNFDGKLELEDWNSEPSGFAVPLAENDCFGSDFKQLAPGEACQFSTVFAPTEPGSHTDTTTAAYSFEDPDGIRLAKEFRLQGQGNGGILTVAPAALAFDFSAACTPESNVSLSNDSSVPVTVSSLEIPDGVGYEIVQALQLPFTLPPGTSSDVGLRYCPTGGPTIDSQLTIESNATNSPTSVELSATPATPGTLTAQPLQLDLTFASTDCSPPGTLTLSNDSQGPVTVTNLSVTPGLGFEVAGTSELPWALQPQESRDVQLRYCPLTGTAPVADELTIESDATNNPLVVVLSAKQDG